mgnify:CR=1 FL=1
MLIYKAVQSNIASKDKKKKWHPCLIKRGNVVDTQMAKRLPNGHH